MATSASTIHGRLLVGRRTASPLTGIAASEPALSKQRWTTEWWKIYTIPPPIPRKPTAQSARAAGAEHSHIQSWHSTIAEYLQPALGVEVREIFLRYRAADISLANDILNRLVEQVREDGMRVLIREEITVQNSDLAGEGKKAGCSGW